MQLELSVNQHMFLKKRKKPQNFSTIYSNLQFKENSKKTSNSYVFCSFCCSAPIEITHPHQVGIQSSSPLAKCWHLIHQHPSPQGTGGIQDSHLGSPFRAPFSALQRSSRVLAGAIFLRSGVLPTQLSTNPSHVLFKKQISQTSEKSLMGTHFKEFTQL